MYVLVKINYSSVTCSKALAGLTNLKFKSKLARSLKIFLRTLARMNVSFLCWIFEIEKYAEIHKFDPGFAWTNFWTISPLKQILSLNTKSKFRAARGVTRDCRVVDSWTVFPEVKHVHFAKSKLVNACESWQFSSKWEMLFFLTSFSREAVLTFVFVVCRLSQSFKQSFAAFHVRKNPMPHRKVKNPK